MSDVVDVIGRARARGQPLSPVPFDVSALPVDGSPAVTGPADTVADPGGPVVDLNLALSRGADLFTDQIAANGEFKLP